MLTLQVCVQRDDGGPVEAVGGRGEGMLLAESGRSADVTADVARGRERAAVVPLRFEDHDVNLGQEQQDQRDRRRRAHRQAVHDRSTLYHQHTLDVAVSSTTELVG